LTKFRYDEFEIQIYRAWAFVMSSYKWCLLASDNGSQPYSYPHRGCEMAGEATPHKYNLAVMQGTSADYVAYHKGRLILLVAIPYQPFRNT